MGLMELPRTEPGQLIVTPHPMLLDGQRNVVWEARAGESLYALLMRNVPELDGQPWLVSIGGAPIDRHLWHHVYPKAGQVIEVRGGVGKSALAVVAMIALTYFTMGAGALITSTAVWGAAGTATAINAGLFIAGSMLINKVLAPKQAKGGSQQQDSVYSISGARNQVRKYEPLPLLFGRVRITPDLLSKPYTWYEGNDQYLGLLLCAGINVGRVEPFYNGETELANYEGVQVYHAGYSQMPGQSIPIYSNADTIDGAELTKDKAWVERTTSADTVRIQINLEYVLGGTGTSGKSYTVGETVEAQYRAAGSTTWLPLVSQNFRSDRFDVRRATLAKDVARGQYDVRVRILGYGNYSGKNTQKNDFQWTTLTSMQADDADYTGVSRTGVRIKATGQLNGSPDELRAVGYADPIPVWDGDAWSTVESSNPGAHILAYARGIVRDGRLLGGMALSDEQIDIESLKAFSLHCAANGYTYDCYIKDARNHDQVLAAIALAGFGQITWAGGRLGVVWVAQEQPLSGVVNMATIKKGQFQVDYSLSNAADGIEYTYLDSTTWETKTLRVPAPGVTTMLNPAQVTGEGVTSEVHAACLARWHLAQSLYQYKDIGYSTDIEHLSYQRLSLLALQHDMTQWGFGGRVVAAASAAGIVTLTLDEPVPSPASGNAYIGLRIPGERVYRVLRVKPFAGESNVIELLDAWPSDAAVPGNSPNNPAHDTLWVYDFKQTPGLRVRVVSIEPESDLKGAAVRVVQEGPEFWNYVLTGHYIPSPNESQLQTRPVASNLRITEQQVVQGDTQFTELTATFDITGPVGNILVLAAGQEQELRDVAQTQTRTATWRIPQADIYSIVVRPFAPDGTAGVAVSATYATEGADAPPVLVDLFDVQERSGGVRLYTWGWLEDTQRSADFAGVEIRHIAGHVSAPDWDAMTPIGDTGYHTASFEAVVPASGQWTFACRSRNTGGTLSAGSRVITVSLSANLGEQIGGIGQDLEALTQQQVAQQQALDAEVHDRVQGDLQTAAAAGADATEKANAARDEAIARVDALAGEIGEIVNAPEWSETEDYIAGWLVREGGNLYRAIVANTNVRPSTNPATWEYIGQFASVAEAAAAALQLATATANELEAEALKISSMQARMPAGSGALETKARVDQVDQARVDGDAALATSLSAVSTATENAQSDASNALTAANGAASAAATAQSTANGAEAMATNALTVANGASTAITAVKATLPSGSGNLFKNAAFESDASDWQAFWPGFPGDTGSRDMAGDQWRPIGVHNFGLSHPGVVQNGAVLWVGSKVQVQPNKKYIISGYVAAHRCFGYLAFVPFDGAGGAKSPVLVAHNDGASGGISLANWRRVSVEYTVPNDVWFIAPGLALYMGGANGSPTGVSDPYAWLCMPMLELAGDGQTLPSAWSPSASGLDAKYASATQQLSVEVDNVSGRLAAKVTHTTDVNGNISGTVSENDGVRSSYSILATVFRVVSNLTGMGMEWQDGYLRIWKGSAQLIMGHSFGAGDLVLWFGPNVGAAECTKANSKIWFDTTGAAYFGGTVTSGVLTASNQSSAVGNISVTTGPFNSNGNTRVIQFGMTYARSYSETGSPAPSGTIGATLNLERRFGGGSWSVISSMPIIGERTVYAVEPGGSYPITLAMSGSSTFWDTSGGGNPEYRVTVTNNRGWPVLAGAGTQRTYVGSTEYNP